MTYTSAANIHSRRQPISLPLLTSAITSSCVSDSDRFGTRMTGTPSTLARRVPGRDNRFSGTGPSVVRGGRAGACMRPARPFFHTRPCGLQGGALQDPPRGQSVTAPADGPSLDHILATGVLVGLVLAVVALAVWG